MKDKVKSWLIKGANTQEGVKLMEMSAATELGLRLVRIYPDACRSFMITTLCRLYSISEDFLVKNERVVYQPKVNPFRSEFPFLGRPGCPVELEALASRKITRFYDYVRLHSQLRDCTTAEECATIARDLIDSYIDNRMIWAELNYYQAHKSLLGKHPIFDELKRRKRLLDLSVKDLIKRQIQVDNNIWRVKSEMKKGDKPHLDLARKEKLTGYENELKEILKLLE